MGQSEFIFDSDIYPGLTVAIIYPESERYDILEQQFEQSGHAFLLHDHNMMVVDGGAVGQSWFTEDHLKVIQAHEAAHYMAGHGKDVHLKGRDEKIEREADWLGYNLLIRKGHASAAKLHSEEYESRYNAQPEEHDRLMTHLDKHLNESTLRKFVRSVVKENFMSHSFEPLIGDAVVNTNPGCIHYGSEGIVITIEDLPEDVGKLISYQVTNNGDTYTDGDVLRKTMDQLGPK